MSYLPPLGPLGKLPRPAVAWKWVPKWLIASAKGVSKGRLFHKSCLDSYGLSGILQGQGILQKSSRWETTGDKHKMLSVPWEENVRVRVINHCAAQFNLLPPPFSFTLVSSSDCLYTSLFLLTSLTHSQPTVSSESQNRLLKQPAFLTQTLSCGLWTK